ncbi:hypothetical protein F5Y18DRAFT_429035 [Xylariaceae sp. FL1019]|nr:hypothetical protein F5Y18DRAFT_429035 [Xylariaceae sp. FL1019]
MGKAINFMIYATGGSPAARIKKSSRGDAYYERRKSHGFDTSSYVSTSSSSSKSSKARGEKYQEHHERYSHHDDRGHHEYNVDQLSDQSSDPYDRESYRETGSKPSSSYLSSPPGSVCSDRSSDHVARNSEPSVYSQVTKSQAVPNPTYVHGSVAGNYDTGYVQSIASSHPNRSTCPQAERSSEVSYKVDPGYYQSNEYAEAVHAAKLFSARSSFRQSLQRSDAHQTVIPSQNQDFVHDGSDDMETAFFSSPSHQITEQFLQYSSLEDDHITLAPEDSMSQAGRSMDYKRPR